MNPASDPGSSSSAIPLNYTVSPDAGTDSFELSAGSRAAMSKGETKAPTKKRRKSRKGLEKIFECDEPNCGKKFTRMEHLARHQLNRELCLLDFSSIFFFPSITF